MKCTGLYSINLYTWRRVSYISASAFFRLRSLPACTRLPPALASHLDSLPACTRLPPALAFRLDSPPTCARLSPGLGILSPALTFRLDSPHAWTRLPPGLGSLHVRMDLRSSPHASRRKPKAQQSVKRHFSAHSSTSCMRHP